ncbi:MAG: hypothetical protein IJS15_01980 [Victivallales bacterium]|nr:hypothetical protein [Victivallales bacterium]
MRTLLQMIERVKTHVRGAENLTWKKSDYENALAEAARRMWRHFLETPGKRCLRAFATLTRDANGYVTLPDDCLRVERVQFVKAGRYIDLHYALPDKCALPCVGPFFANGCRLCWTDDGVEGTVRILNVPTDLSIRVVYFQEPVFPFVDNGTFRAPDGGATETYPGIPELADSACEHFAAALLLGEETSDPQPMNYHGNQYSALLKTMTGAADVKPSRTYVRRAGKR